MNYNEMIEQYDLEDKYQEIVDLIEMISDEELTFWHIMEKARAYNNLEDDHNGYYLKKSIETLKVLEFELRDDAYWNWIIGYAYFYLDDYSTALYHLRKTELEWDDKDIQDYISTCLKELALPKFEQTFKERCEFIWTSFLKIEEEIRLNTDPSEEELEEEHELLEQLFNKSFPILNFDIERNPDKIKLILSTDSRFSMLYILLYFINKAPKELVDRWDFQIGREAHDEAFLKTVNDTYPSESIKVWIDNEGDFGFNLSLYQEDLAEDYKTIDEYLVFNAALYLLDYSIGELANMVYIDSIEILEEEKDGDYILLSDLKATMIQDHYNFDLDAQIIVDNRKVTGEPTPKEEFHKIRDDIHFISTSLPDLVDNYDDNVHYNVDFFHDHGIVAGFFYYPLISFQNLFDEDYGEAILQSASDLSDSLDDAYGEDFKIMGFEVGDKYAYIQFISFDFNDDFLNKAKTVFEDSIFDFAGFSPFRTLIEPTIVLAKPLDEYFTIKNLRS